MHYLKSRLIESIYISIEFILYLLIVFIPLPNFAVRCLMITSIVINAATAIALRKHEIFIFALLMTIGADTCLSYLSPQNFEGGITFFVITQLVYAVYFAVFDENKKREYIIIAFRAFFMVLLSIVAFIVLKDTPNYDSMAYVICFVMLYVPNLVCNLITAFLLNNKLMGIGFTLFLLCDTFIGLNVIFTSIMPLASNHPFLKFLNLINWPWLFYVPSQVLIVISEKHGSHFLLAKKSKE